jgi:hypothetical protein
MPGFLTYECRKNGHQFEKLSNKDRTKCPKCGSWADILWISPRSPHAQLRTPIVLWKYADGTIGVAGGADSKTPHNAERLEVRSAIEYRKYAKEINSQLKSKEDRREEGFQRAREAMERELRSNLAYRMGQEDDPVAKDIYREALFNRRPRPGSSFREFFSIAMENDRSNYDG